MNELLGAGNGLGQYALVLLVYGALVVVMRYAHPTVEPGFRKTFVILYVIYAIASFVANYVLSLVGAMSFLPWVNNFIHTFLWVGLCLTFLYAGCHNRPLWEQVVMFAIFSFAVKLAERQILGTWEQAQWFGIPGNLAYMLCWSLFDGVIPVASMLGLRWAATRIEGLVVPRPTLW
jgi:hypothetical protein